MSQKSDVLFVGIDLGTSRSSISAGNGQRQWIESYVGWPKDFVAAQVVGKPVLFGAEVLEHRLIVDVCRPLQHGIIKEGIDRNEPFHIYKIFVLCEVLGGDAATSHETDEVAFFPENQLPELSLSRTTPAQVARLFEHLRCPGLPPDFD